jgi:hypothetical protein
MEFKLNAIFGDRRSALVGLIDTHILGEGLRLIADFEGPEREQFERNSIVCAIGRAIGVYALAAAEFFDRESPDAAAEGAEVTQPKAAVQ